MFSSDNRYITRGIKEINKKNPILYLQLWEMIDSMEVLEKDYLQVFNLRPIIGKRIMQEVEHVQEEPPYRGIMRFYTDRPVEAKVFVIDDGEHSTMLLASEY